jgi:hypothetical protein
VLTFPLSASDMIGDQGSKGVDGEVPLRAISTSCGGGAEVSQTRRAFQVFF